MRKTMMLVFATAMTLALTACNGGSNDAPPPFVDEPKVGEPGVDNAVVRSRAIYYIAQQNGQTVMMKLMDFVIPTATAANPTSIPITVISAPNASMTVNSAALVSPGVVTDTTSLGSITISALSDNSLKVCGTGNQKCTQAIIRMYTTGTAGAGLYNTADSYGAPISSGLSVTRAVVGLGSVNAGFMQGYTIPANKNKITQADFTPAMTYNIDVDFSNAGSGTYSTTLVIEYVLAL